MQNSGNKFLESFRRITSAGNYIPEIDGLRFVAIFWVVVWMHLPTMLDKHLFGGSLFSNHYAFAVMIEGGNGVSLFFMVSGFILSLPFINERLNNGKKVVLSQYYLRRLTRLEPPYLVALIIAFLATMLAKNYSFADMLPHFGASAVYMHNVIYDSASPILGVAWSLEVEVQFYLLAPFFCFVFLISNSIFRRVLLFLLIILFALYAWKQNFVQPTILPHFLCYFLAGMLLADLYMLKHRPLLNNRLGFVLGILIFVGSPFIISVNLFSLFILKFALFICAFYLVLFNERLKHIFQNRYLTLVGGMCYSIYLLHTLIISALFNGLKQWDTLGGIAGIIFYTAIAIAAVLIISAIFYKLVEQPCMRKGWWLRKRSFK